MASNLLARFAFNIYGSSAQDPSPEPPRHRPSSQGIIYSCDKEITCLTQLTHPLGRLTANYDPLARLAQVIIGGKSYLKLVVLDPVSNNVTADVSLIDSGVSGLGLGRLHQPRLFNVNTAKCNGDFVATGLTSGAIQVYQISLNGKATLAHKLEDHKRVVNSLDFVDSDQLLFLGSQDGTVKLWDLRSYQRKPVHKLVSAQHSDPVRSCQYSPHQRVRGKMTVLSAHDSGSLCKYDLRYPGLSSTSSTPERKWNYHTGPALSLHIHPESEYVLTGGRDRKICVWNYSDSGASGSGLPEIVMNTYGPVMKIRWCELPVDGEIAERDLREQLDYADDWSSRHSPLYSYDFACSYLNDDPTITVHNLRRKHIPTEIVCAPGRKPFQNFIWAKNLAGVRRLWALTKSNGLVSYNVSAPDSLQNVFRPADDLPLYATTWSPGYTNLSLVSQTPTDFEYLDLEFSMRQSDSLKQSENIRHDSRHDDHSWAVETPISVAPSLSSSAGITTPGYFKSPSNNSPKERPPLLSQSSYQASYIHQHGPKSPSPGPFQRISESGSNVGSVHMRPSLPRNPSQSTQDSGSLGPHFMLPPTPHNLHNLHRPSVLNLVSPYLVETPIPVALNDDHVFETLASNYHTSVPDGFSLVDVCCMNARIAASVNKLRDGQTWHMLATAFEEDYIEREENELASDLENKDEHAYSLHDDSKLTSSEIGNLVGSYNSNSTLTTNYGAPRVASGTLLNRMGLLGKESEIHRSGEFLPRSLSSHSLHEMKGFSRANSSSGNRPFLNSPEASPEKVVLEKPSLEKLGSPPGGPHHDGRPAEWGTTSIYKSNNRSLENLARRREIPPRTQYSTSSSPSKSLPWAMSPEHISGPSSLTSAGYIGDRMSANSGHSVGRVRASFLSMRNSPAFSQGPTGRGSISRNAVTKEMGANLERVEESSIRSESRRLELTRALIQNAQVDDLIDPDASQINVPWSTVNLLQKTLDWSMSQGDLIMSATLIMLFYGPFRKMFSDKVLPVNSCLEVLALYIETLQRKELFTDAVNIVNDAPADLKSVLTARMKKEMDMRFYCPNCQKLLLNETSREALGPQSENFGYWYCDQCGQRQMNCVYCEEPCKGLAVVTSLNCGHRGHFGCLQEWTLEGGNDCCPRGCDVDLPDMVL